MDYYGLLQIGRQFQKNQQVTHGAIIRYFYHGIVCNIFYFDELAVRTRFDADVSKSLKWLAVSGAYPE